MKNRFLPFAAALALFVPSVFAQQWSVGAGTGPFVFGDFAERTVRAAAGGTTGNLSHLKLTAKTRAGIAADVQRDFADHFAVRLEGTFTSAPLAVKSGSGSVEIDAGQLHLSTWTLPLEYLINPRGAFRFHVGAGPALAIYNVHRRAGSTAAIAPFEGTRNRFGAAAEGGVAWWLSSRFAVEWNIAYIRTASPFEKSDFIASELIHIPQSQNAHTTVGARWRF